MDLTTVRELNQHVEQEAVFLHGLRAEINKMMVGQEKLVDRMLIALLADGHILLNFSEGSINGSAQKKNYKAGDIVTIVGPNLTYKPSSKNTDGVVFIRLVSEASMGILECDKYFPGDSDYITATFIATEDGKITDLIEHSYVEMFIYG